MELSDQVLKTLMDADQKRGNFFSLKSITEKHHPTLTPARIAKIIDCLEEKGYIQTSTHKTKGVPHFIKVNSAAYTYFKNREARKAIVELKKAGLAEQSQHAAEESESVAWNLKMALIYYSAGLMSGIVLMWVKAVLFQ